MYEGGCGHIFGARVSTRLDGARLDTSSSDLVSTEELELEV